MQCSLRCVFRVCFRASDTKKHRLTGEQMMHWDIENKDNLNEVALFRISEVLLLYHVITNWKGFIVDPLCLQLHLKSPNTISILTRRMAICHFRVVGKNDFTPSHLCPILRSPLIKRSQVSLSLYIHLCSLFRTVQIYHFHIFILIHDHSFMTRLLRTNKHCW